MLNSNKQFKISPIKTIIAILIPPLELWIGPMAIKLVSGQIAKAAIMDLIFFLGFIAAIWLYHDVLSTDWKQFKHRWFFKFLLAIGGVVVSYLILIGARLLLKSVGLADGANTTDLLSIQSATLGLVGSLTVLMAPFTEEIIFRHALFYQWKNRGLLTWLMFIVSAILFGLGHWNNFDGNVIAMIPYMLVGAWYALIYYFSHNIWQNILTHFLFDIMQFLGALLVFVVAFFQ
ncbi:CPBP family intramembrane metalloprotease [Pediococcus inopinatus]|uniref:CPBP family intramembrane metalloprotease n=1 Tax=Pediococcus inopinatus TaxID=114090 RepID=A0ABZ0Q5K5_9LACO|nr:type II CAAX endopeptidase family protein [Pediococcus inopinatus]WPC22254.1 CPBP family intramembrane metalloprotease [Pediococcus inopinatus]